MGGVTTAYLSGALYSVYVPQVSDAPILTILLDVTVFRPLSVCYASSRQEYLELSSTTVRMDNRRKCIRKTHL